MSSSPSLPNTSCGRCHIAASDLGEALKQCAGCHSVQYCSKDCQRRDWSSHKQQCLDIRAGRPPTRTRTTTRIDYLDFMRERNETRDTSDVVYYLETSTPHIHDISVSGPYRNLETVHIQAMLNFGDECPEGRDTLNDLVQNGRHLSFVHIASPINGDPNRVENHTHLPPGCRARCTSSVPRLERQRRGDGLRSKYYSIQPKSPAHASQAGSDSTLVPQRE